MDMPWCPRIVVGDTDYTFELPMRPPDFPVGGIGGSAESAAGLPASYGVRDDDMLDVHLRFYESERPDVTELVRQMQKHFATIAFYADKDDAEPSNTCYLRSPERGSDWQPTRSDELAGGRGFELTIRLRSITGPWEIEYFADVLE